jgi:hypothetical protein
VVRDNGRGRRNSCDIRKRIIIISGLSGWVDRVDRVDHFLFLAFSAEGPQRSGSRFVGVATPRGSLSGPESSFAGVAGTRRARLPADDRPCSRARFLAAVNSS